jgi:hypothetical protein
MFTSHGKLLSAAVLFAGAAFAQQLTPQQLKQACETSPANTVLVNGPLKISGFTSRVNVASGCRIVFAATGALETDSINMGFAGPLVLQGGLKSGAKLVKTLLEAPSINAGLAGGENLVELSESTVRASAGNVAVSLGDSSQWVVVGRFAGRAHAMIATGSIVVTGARKLDASLSGTSLNGAAGISFSAAGDELTLTLGDTNLISTAGPIDISSPGRQATLQYANGIVRAASGITVTFSGSEGQLDIKGVQANAGTGSVSFVTALSGARPAKSIVTESTITAGAGFQVEASLTGESGEAALESSRVTAGRDIRVQSGPLGTTNVKLNSLRSNTFAGASTGPSGSCTAENNTVIAPLQALCQ